MTGSWTGKGFLQERKGTTVVPKESEGFAGGRGGKCTHTVTPHKQVNTPVADSPELWRPAHR